MTVLLPQPPSFQNYRYEPLYPAAFHAEKVRGVLIVGPFAEDVSQGQSDQTRNCKLFCFVYLYHIGRGSPKESQLFLCHRWGHWGPSSFLQAWLSPPDELRLVSNPALPGPSSTLFLLVPRVPHTEGSCLAQDFPVLTQQGGTSASGSWLSYMPGLSSGTQDLL